MAADKAAADKSRSKFLSLVLRHDPGSIGLTLDPAGWADIDALLAAAARAGVAMDRDDLARIVAESDKQRFTLSQDGLRIRAAQGHSVAVELGLEPLAPPAILYHGTATKALAAILAEGLRPMARRQVHLSLDRETAERVGRRHGKAAVLQVDAAGMQAAGHRFFRAENGVWLVDAVPPTALTVLSDTD